MSNKDRLLTPREDIALFQLNLQRKEAGLYEQTWSELTDVIKEAYLEWAEQILAKATPSIKAETLREVGEWISPIVYDMVILTSWDWVNPKSGLRQISDVLGELQAQLKEWG